MLAGLFAIVVGIDARSRNMPEHKISEHWTTQQDVSETPRNPTHFFPSWRLELQARHLAVSGATSGTFVLWGSHLSIQ